ncbi:flavin reductase [Amycolatopsis rubida]|uniref:NADH-FMN oxidoreductase RutF, flavin reductase (DIM6/NTAB) family n=1 Tax=Amycolatopsis rubida TaxID=112413 RepID=A0A1I5HW25_9PSEU|nr:flavin reductase [Amycolatopsis rubida]SFO52495.1 NADH-FMN oxidoreductase RutF, flavin reductase (DIM6/NTAB) family [Amycolatopsis rubida]
MTSDQQRIDSFRRAAGRFASGVTVVTTALEGHLYGITATSFVSLSLNPLLVTVSINSHSPILGEIRASGVFAINVLGRHQQDVSACFARRGRGRSKERFDEVETRTEATGAPVVTGALSWFDCTVHTMLGGGDHIILVGEVVSAGGGTGQPLLYWSGEYRELNTAEEAEADIGRIADSLSIQLHLHGMRTEQLLEAQHAVEPAAAALAARAAADDQIAQLRALVEESEKHVHDASRYNPLSLEFHSRLGLLSGNPAIAASVGALNRPRESVYAVHTNAERASRAVDAHRRILQAIEDRDEDAARRLMTEHLGVVAQGMPC